MEGRYAFGLKAFVIDKDLIILGHAPTTFGVFTDIMFLRDVCFSLKAYRFHPFKWVAHLEVSAVSKYTVSTIFNVVAHHV